MAGPNTKGKDYNFFTRFGIVNMSFPSDADVIFPFSGNPSFSLINEGADTVEYSFNGLTKHGDLVPSTPSAALFFNNRGINSVWFRVASGNTTNVRVEATATGMLGIAGSGGSGGGGGGGPTTIAGPLGSKTKLQSVAVTLSTDEPAIPVQFSGALPAGTNVIGHVITDSGSTVVVSNFPATQPVSGTVTSNIGTTNGLALDATLTGGSQRTILVNSGNTPIGIGGASPNIQVSDSIVDASFQTFTNSFQNGSTVKAITVAVKDTSGGVATLINGTHLGLVVEGIASGTPIPVSGTVAISNSFALDATLAKLTIAQGTSLGSNTQAMVGGSVTTAAPSYSTGQISPLSLTTGGSLRVDGSGATQPVSGTVTANIGTSGSLALDASITALSAKFGTLGQKAMAGSAPVVIASDQSAIPASQSGTWTVQPGNTANTTPWLATINQGGNSAAVTGSNALKVDGSAITQPVSGTVTANIGTTNGLSLDATLTKLTVAQGAALGSNTQAMVGGSVTTAAPSYTTGNINPLSLTTAGALRIDGSGTTQPVSGTITANIGTSGSLALDATLSTLSAKIASTSTLADATTNPTITSIGVFNHVFNGTTWDRIRSGLLGAQSSATGIQNNLSMGRYNASAPTLTDGQIINQQLDVSGNLKTAEQFAPGAEDNTNSVFAIAVKPLAGATYAPSLFTNYGANITLNVKASSGNVTSVMCQNLNAAIRYLQLHNTATTPSASAVPLISIPVPASSTVILGSDFFSIHGLNFTNGIAFGFSTTSGTYTAGTAADQMTEIVYK